MSLYLGSPPAEAVPIFFATAESWPKVESSLPAAAAAYANACAYEPTAGRILIVPTETGELGGVLCGLAPKTAPNRDPFLPGRLVAAVPPGVYRFANAPHDPTLATLAWELAAYRFDRYKKDRHQLPQLCPPQDVDFAKIARIAAAVALGRDLINTPANDLGPDELESAAVAVATRFQASVSVLTGCALLAANFPLIHVVGRAAEQAPRLVDISWGDPRAPKVTLVGKGVCFDTGGLDIKPESAMQLMKKDMGGAATALALAHMIMSSALPVRLRVLLPIVENAISSAAMRPGDVYPSRKGISVEIGNTDAEGRLILADALALADEEAPDLLVDFATLTGAARVALGPDLPAFYTMDETFARQIATHAERVFDPVWRMPLWDPYDKLLDGKVADLSNISASPFAGSITAALFLRRFVERAKAWAHFDIYAWTPAEQSARPEGGEIQVARLLFDLIETGCAGAARRDRQAAEIGQ